MIAWIQKILRHLLTGKDGQTHDIGRWGIAISMLAVMAHDAYQLAHGIQTNVKDLAFALSAILGGGMAGLGFKAKTEPE